MPSPVVSTPLNKNQLGYSGSSGTISSQSAFTPWVIRIYCFVRAGADLHIEVPCVVCPRYSKTKGYNKASLRIPGFDKQQMFSRAWRKGVKKEKKQKKRRNESKNRLKRNSREMNCWRRPKKRQGKQKKRKNVANKSPNNELYEHRNTATVT